ncbi:MAG: biotin--[acetyl-CoA-carboxylase] ligase [Ignavibacteria bacterium]
MVKKDLLSELIYFEKLDSTNTYSKINNLPDNTLVITSHQTNGKGRFGKDWISIQDKNLTFTLTKCFRINIDDIHLVNFYSSYILFQTIKNFISGSLLKDPDLILKWPNDILLNRKKIAGILLDVKDLTSPVKKFIIGFGININQEKFPPDIEHKATSLFNETKTKINKENLLTEFINMFYDNTSFLIARNDLMNLWTYNSKMTGMNIEYKQLDDDQPKRATVMNISNDGGLVVKLSDGRETKFYSGEISIIY